jgi:hypothetical protein
VSVPDIHETSRFRRRSRYQDPNYVTDTVKSRHATLTESEDDEKANTTEDEKTSAGVTTTEYSRCTWQRSIMTVNRCLPCIPTVIGWSFDVKCIPDSVKYTTGFCIGTSGHFQKTRSRKRNKDLWIKYYGLMDRTLLEQGSV